jgi:hypothetical protein
MSRLRLVAATAVALVLLLPASALAATTGVSGTVADKAGSLVAGAEITVLVEGTDMILSTTSDANGAWSLELDVDPGAVLDINTTGPSVTGEPDADGCVTTTTGSGQATVTLPDEGAPDAVRLVLDTELTGTVCPATPKPEKTPRANKTPSAPHTAAPARQQPAQEGLTPPSTDTIAASGDGRPAGTALLLGILAAVSGLTLLATTRRARR